MDTINKTFTIQWVGPFHSLEELNAYKRDDETNGLDCFNVYCFEARYRSNSRWRSYLGIHQKNDGIDRRLNQRHEHFKKFLNYPEKNIWIGAFGNEKDQTPENIDIVETLFISTYKEELKENIMKKKSLPYESICVINLWYNIDEKVRHNRRNTISFMDDAIVYDEENRRILHGRLSEITMK